MKVLVVVPTHNRTHFLPEAMQSIVDQDVQPYQVVVTGNVPPPPEFFKRLRCTYVPSDDNLTVRLNAVIEASDCDAFIVLCDDDMLLPEYLAKTTAKMLETGADVVYTEFNNEPVTALCTKAMWEKAGRFAEVGFFDWDFWLSCRDAGSKSVPLREHLFIYRQHEEQRETHHKWKADGSWDRWTAIIMERHPLSGKQ